MSVQECTFDTASVFPCTFRSPCMEKKVETEIASRAVFLVFVKFLLYIPSSCVPSEPNGGHPSKTTSLDQFKSQTEVCPWSDCCLFPPPVSAGMVLFISFQSK